MSTPHQPTHDPFKPLFMLLLATVCWGFSFPLMKGVLLAQARLVPGASDWFLASQTMVVRFGVAALVMLVICGRSARRVTPTELKLGIGLGICAGIGTLFQMAGLNHTLASTSAFLTQLYALLIPVTLALVNRRWPSPVVWVSCGLVVIGMGTLCGVNWLHFRLGRGEWMTLLSSVAFMGQILWLDRKEFAACDKTRATLVLFATMSVMFLPMALLTAGEPRDLWRVNASGPVLVMIAFLTLVCAVAAFSLMNHWQPHLPPTHAGLIYCAEPVFASLYALVLPGLMSRYAGIEYANEQLTAHLWIGGGLITLANILIQRDQ